MWQFWRGQLIRLHTGFHFTGCDISLSSRTSGLISTFWYLNLKCQSRLQQTTNFATTFLILNKNKAWYCMRIVCFSWNIMPYLLFLKKRQNLKLSSAANCRWLFMGLKNIFVCFKCCFKSVTVMFFCLLLYENFFTFYVSQCELPIRPKWNICVVSVAYQHILG